MGLSRGDELIKFIADNGVPRKELLEIIIYGLYGQILYPEPTCWGNGCNDQNLDTPPNHGSEEQLGQGIEMEALQTADNEEENGNYHPGGRESLSNPPSDIDEISIHTMPDVGIQTPALLRGLLFELASQLQLLRVRAVIRSLASLGVFLAAFGFSVALAFGNVGESTTVITLSLGLLYAWLPLLEIFTIVDRNPSSPDHWRYVRSYFPQHRYIMLNITRVLMSRWLYNVDAIRTWDRHKGQNSLRWWAPGVGGKDDVPAKYRIGKFMGQGRRMQYCGVAEALLACTKESIDKGNWDDATLATLTESVEGRLKGRRPFLWYITALISLVLVLAPIMAAMVVDYFTPTFGFGCWSSSAALCGILSTASWIIQFSVKPGRQARRLAHIANFLATGWLFTLTLFYVSLVPPVKLMEVRA
jgi:hypothetical protein